MFDLKVSKLKERLKKAFGKAPQQNRCAMVMLEYLVERDAKVSNMAAENLALRQEIQRLQIRVEDARDISDQQRKIKMQLMARLREAEQKIERAEKERFEALEKLYSYRNICGVTTPERLVELIEADRNGRCVIAEKPPESGNKYVLQTVQGCWTNRTVTVLNQTALKVRENGFENTGK